MTRRNEQGTVRAEGGLFTRDFLERVRRGDDDLDGLRAPQYHLPKGERLADAISRSWARLVPAWKSFRTYLGETPEGELATSITREQWLLILFYELGFGRLEGAKGRLKVGGTASPISHVHGHSPIHLLGWNVDLDTRTRGVAGAARTSPHGLVQDFLNRSDEHLWGFLSNGRRLRILRDNAALTRQAFLEFDLEAMMEGEAYSDFGLLWLLAHQSRALADIPSECWLERWLQAANEEGSRALDKLRAGVEEAIQTLGTGLVAHPANERVRTALRDEADADQALYRELLRLIYRLLFLFVAEDRDLLLSPLASRPARTRYTTHYSTQRLRELARSLRGSRHGDLWRGLRTVMERLGSDEGFPDLALPALGSLLWDPGTLPLVGTSEFENRDLLAALRALAYTREGRLLRPVDFRNLGAEELGSVYESLLELHPVVDLTARTVSLGTAEGHERKLTGSYYTPDSLVQRLLDSALDPVLDAACSQEDPAQAVLDLKVCDPSCGSGHFLIAAAHRIATRLAQLRTGDLEPSPPEQRRALRDVIGHCLYGVDLNPMAVELCKVSLWLEALEPGKPLSFLEHRIRCGNSLLGTTPKLIAEGVPDDAFAPLAGDDPDWIRDARRRNRDAHRGQRDLYTSQVAETTPGYATLRDRVRELDRTDDTAIEGIRAKARRLDDLRASSEYLRAKEVADLLCALFVWRHVPGGVTPPTHEQFERLRDEGTRPEPPVQTLVDGLVEQYGFFHWHVAFPEVFDAPNSGQDAAERAGWTGGFDVVLGNPPWERVKLQEKEWFATRAPEVAGAPNAAARGRLIAALEEDDAPLFEAFLRARREAEGASKFLRSSGRYPLCGRGDINTYTVFTETARDLLAPRGRAGFLVPSGIATDDTTKDFFREIVDSRSLVSLYDFENRRRLFPGIDSRIKFCLLTLTGRAAPNEQGARFVFFALQPSELDDPERSFVLTPEDIALLNPNTRTCPIFRTQRDAEITKKIYRRVPVLWDENKPDGNPWGLRFRTMFHMSNDSGLFRTRTQLEAEGWTLEGNVFVREADRCLPLYEAKMIHHYDHRFGDYADLPKGSKSTQLPNVPLERLQDPDYAPLPRYWVPEHEVEDRLVKRRTNPDSGTPEVVWQWPHPWLLGWRDITNATNERTVIASLLPRVGVGNKIPVMLLDAHACTQFRFLLACLSSFVLDFAARQKIGGTTLNYFIYKQLPVLHPSVAAAPCSWDPETDNSSWVNSRVETLLASATDIAVALGVASNRESCDEDARLELRCELDAAFFTLYGLDRGEVEHVMDTFPIVRRHDEAEHGSYRTKTRILELFDEYAELSTSCSPARA